jgi:SAM-dependent methyltransferase
MPEYCWSGSPTAVEVRLRLVSRTPTNTMPVNHANPVKIDCVAAKVCLALTHLFTRGPLRRFSVIERALGNRYESQQNYETDRVSNVADYRRLFEPFVKFEDKTVLELGCSRGYLLDAFRQQERFTAIGADINEEVLLHARADYGHHATFIKTTPRTIPLPDNSVDVIYTVDTIEHLSRPYDIFMDAYRILKPDGIFLIHFGPWLNPMGAHLEDIIPFPWPHVIFSMDTLLDVAAHIYESIDHKHACYWYDDNGALKPNPYLDREHWHEYLNDLTIRKFNRLLRRLPYETVHFQPIGFGGKAFPLARFVSRLAQVPVFNEVFTKAVLCVLRKPNQPKITGSQEGMNAEVSAN